MRKPLTRAELDTMGCGATGCTHDHHQEGLALHAACHPSAAVETWYRQGVLSFRCKRCSTVVVEVAVAEAPQ